MMFSCLVGSILKNETANSFWIVKMIIHIFNIKRYLHLIQMVIWPDQLNFPTLLESHHLLEES